MYRYYQERLYISHLQSLTVWFGAPVAAGVWPGGLLRGAVDSGHLLPEACVCAPLQVPDVAGEHVGRDRLLTPVRPRRARRQRRSTAPGAASEGGGGGDQWWGGVNRRVSESDNAAATVTSRFHGCIIAI